MTSLQSILQAVLKQFVTISLIHKLYLLIKFGFFHNRCIRLDFLALALLEVMLVHVCANNCYNYFRLDNIKILIDDDNDQVPCPMLLATRFFHSIIPCCRDYRHCLFYVHPCSKTVHHLLSVSLCLVFLPAFLY